MSKITIIEGNSNDKDQVRVLMVKGEKGEQGDLNKSHIVDNLVTDDANKVLSARQGKILDNKIDVEKGRIDNLIQLEDGSTTGDAELADIRVGINGKTYQSAGTAVRSQISPIYDSLDIYMVNIYNYHDITADKILVRSSGSTINNTGDYNGSILANQIWDIKYNDTIYCTTGYGVFCVYDKNGNYIKSYSSSSKVYTVDAPDAKYLRWFVTANSSTYTTKFMICINHELPSEYVSYNIYKSKVDDVLKSLEKKVFDKAVLVLNFDNFDLSDDRFNIVKNEYGFKATVASNSNSSSYDSNIQQIYNTVLKNGWDIGIYSNNSTHPEFTYGENAYTNTSAKVQTAWDNYVKNGLDILEMYNVHNPVVWLARQNRSCNAMTNSLIKYGFKMCRADRVGDTNTDKNFKEEFAFTTGTRQMDVSNINNTIAYLQTAVNNKLGISVFTHKIYATEQEAIEHYGITETALRTFLNAVKTFVDQDKLEVITYRELYSKYFEKDGYENDYNRIVKSIYNS